MGGKDDLDGNSVVGWMRKDEMVDGIYLCAQKKTAPFGGCSATDVTLCWLGTYWTCVD